MRCTGIALSKRLICAFKTALLPLIGTAGSTVLCRMAVKHDTT